MRKFWLIQTLLGFVGTGMLIYFFLFSEINPFLIGMILNICVSYFTLSFSNYIFLRNHEKIKGIKKIGLPVISITAFVILCFSILFPVYFKDLWNITLTLHCITFGIALIQLIPQTDQLFNRITKFGLIFCTIFLSILILLELETPILYNALGSLFALESLMILVSIFLDKKMQK